MNCGQLLGTEQGFYNNLDYVCFTIFLKDQKSSLNLLIFQFQFHAVEAPAYPPQLQTYVTTVLKYYSAQCPLFRTLHVYCSDLIWSDK